MCTEKVHKNSGVNEGRSSALSNVKSCPEVARLPIQAQSGAMGGGELNAGAGGDGGDGVNWELGFGGDSRWLLHCCHYLLLLFMALYCNFISKFAAYRYFLVHAVNPSMFTPWILHEMMEALANAADCWQTIRYLFTTLTQVNMANPFVDIVVYISEERFERVVHRDASVWDAVQLVLPGLMANQILVLDDNWIELEEFAMPLGANRVLYVYMF